MNPAHMQYIKTQPLVTALFWFIENIAEDDPDRNEIFFALRERVRNEGAGAYCFSTNGAPSTV